MTVSLYAILSALGQLTIAYTSMLSVSTNHMIPGEVALVRVKAPTSLNNRIQLKFGKNQLLSFPCFARPKEDRCAFISIPADYKDTSIKITAEWPDGTTTRHEDLSITVGKSKFRVTQVKVATKITRPSQSDKSRIDSEAQELNAVYSKISSEPLWDGSFTLPVKSKVTGTYGEQREFNKEVISIHRGVDLKAGTTTPVLAANKGVVILAKEFFLAGNLVIIDHGAGLLTSYGHLSSIDVKAGQTVKKGKRLGLAGSTGRANGPHLHWAVRVNGVASNPLQFRSFFNKTSQKK